MTKSTNFCNNLDDCIKNVRSIIRQLIDYFINNNDLNGKNSSRKIYQTQPVLYKFLDLNNQIVYILAIQFRIGHINND